MAVKKRTEECKTNRIKVSNILIERGEEMKKNYFWWGRKENQIERKMVRMENKEDAGNRGKRKVRSRRS